MKPPAPFPNTPTGRAVYDTYRRLYDFTEGNELAYTYPGDVITFLRSDGLENLAWRREIEAVTEECLVVTRPSVTMARLLRQSGLVLSRFDRVFRWGSKSHINAWCLRDIQVLRQSAMIADELPAWLPDTPVG